jgi:hypothetical protein
VDCGDFILGAEPLPLKQGLARIAAILARYPDSGGKLFRTGARAENGGGLAGFGRR